MKHLQLLGLIVCAAIFTSCETTQTAGQGNQERKRLAALQEQRQRPQPDETEQNLWSAQQSTLNREGNPIRNY